MRSEAKSQAILYAAKSTVDKRGSNATQLEDARALAEAEGLEVIATYVDEDASAYHGNRGPGLAAALDHGERVSGSVVVQHSDRLARGDGVQARHLVQLVLEAKARGIRLRSVEDDSSLESVLMAAAMGERNTEDSRRKGAAIRAGLARRRAAGRRVGGSSYGLTWERNENDERITVHDPAQAPVVVRIYDEFLAGRKKLQIAKALNSEGIPSNRGKKWHSQVINSILRNPLYAGYVRDGEELIEAQHAPIVPRERWHEAQALQSSLEKTFDRGRPVAGQHLFRQGFLRCGQCGAGIVPRTDRNKDGTLNERYRCQGRYIDPANCSMTVIPRAQIDSAVYAYFEQVGLDIEATREQLIAVAERERSELIALRDVAERELSAAQSRLRRIQVDYTDGEISAAEWRILRFELEPQAKAAEAERDRFNAKLSEIEAGPELRDLESEILAQLAHIRAVVAGQVRDAKGVDGVRAALLRLFDRFILHFDVPAEGHVELIHDGFWIEPIVSQHAVNTYDEKLRPILERKPLVQADDKSSSSLVRVQPVSSPISA